MPVPSRLQRLVRAGLRALSPTGLSLLSQDRVKTAPADFIRFPCNPPPVSRLEAWMIKRGGGPMTCTVCGAFTRFKIESDNLREGCSCVACGAMNRNRQIAYVLCGTLAKQIGKPIHSFANFAQFCRDLGIYNTEARGAFHEQLRALPGYRSSEYFGPSHRSGDLVGGVLHEDLMELSFPDAALDVVLSSDVFEHVPDPYRAHREVHRVLRRGGRHVFTVPFHPDGFLDETRATLNERGAPVFLAPPIYHQDPLSPRGALVYTIFGLEMLVKLREIGFSTNLYHLSAPWLGILGPNALVFDAVRIA